MFQSLSVSELKSFKSYLQSPFFNENELLSRLCELVTTVGLDDKPAVFHQLFPGRKYDDKEFRYLLSDLSRMLEHFFCLRAIGKNELIQKSLVAAELSSRNCNKAYNHVHLELTKGSHQEDAAYYKAQFEHAEVHLMYSATTSLRSQIPDYSDTMNFLDTFYVAKKMQLSCEITNLSNILNRKFEIPLSDEISAMVSSGYFDDKPVIQIYYHILLTLKFPNEEAHFVKAAELIKKNKSLFGAAELNEMYQYIKNYCVRKINSGKTEYLQKLFGIYKEMLLDKKLTRHEYLSQYEFKNIVSISLRLGEFKWCRNFLDTQISLLAPHERDNALTYNTAYFHFMNQEYRKAIRKLQEVLLNDVFYQLDSRVIVLKSFFELDETESFYYQASAFRLFLLRNKSISEYQKTIYRNLIRFLTAIHRAGISKAKLNKIRVELMQEKNVADLNYLLRKIAIALGEPSEEPIYSASTISE